MRSDAENQFRKVFNSKTGNKWDERANFVPHPGKYDLIKLDLKQLDQSTKVVSTPNK